MITIGRLRPQQRARGWIPCCSATGISKDVRARSGAERITRLTSGAFRFPAACRPRRSAPSSVPVDLAGARSTNGWGPLGLDERPGLRPEELLSGHRLRFRQDADHEPGTLPDPCGNRRAQPFSRWPPSMLQTHRSVADTFPQASLGRDPFAVADPRSCRRIASFRGE